MQIEDSKMKLSIIIPVFRSEATLDRCLRSIIDQPLAGMEVVLVDDGSPDGCPLLCDEWASRDSRITVIHKTNGGLSSARNAGLEHAQGEYVTFIDADDYIGEGTLNAMMEDIGDCDLMEYPIYQHYGSDRQQLLALTDRTYDTPYDYWLQTKAYLHTYACNKIYRRHLFEKVRFPEGRVFEDAYTLPQLLKQQPHIATTSRGIYYYTENRAGITATATGQELAQLLDAHLQSQMPMDDCYYLHLLNIQLDVCRLTGQAPKLPFRHVNITKSLTSHPARLTVKAIIQNTLGINALCRINKLTSR